MDSSQIELALLNLVVNAKDAMPGGGTITIRARQREWHDNDPKKPVELAAGRYAEVSVQDTGTGISNDTMAHIFEPFFTTKEAGSGTGVGLAAVHGVIREALADLQQGRVPTRRVDFETVREIVGFPEYDRLLQRYAKPR